MHSNVECSIKTQNLPAEGMLGCKANEEKMVNFVVRSFIITSVIPTRQLSAQIIFTHLHRFTGKSRRKIIFHEKVKISQLALEETKH